MIKNNLLKLFNVSTTHCGVKTNARGEVIQDDMDEGVQLSWRDDPRKSFADWKLIVRDGTGSKTYHLHKAILAHGKRSSQFFIRNFENDLPNGTANRRSGGAGSRDRSKSQTEVALPKRAAQLVPALLDFIYDDKLDLTSTIAPAVRHLANHFDVRQLYSLVSSFIQSDLTSKTAATYIHQADQVNDTELLGHAIDVAAQNLRVLESDSGGGWFKIPPHLFPQVISNSKAVYPSHEWLSELVGKYIRGRRLQAIQATPPRRRNHKGKVPPPPPPIEEISDETFYFLTHAQILPKIAPSEAIWYLTFARETFGPEVLVDETMGGVEGSLRRRCIVAVSRDWRGMLLGPLRTDKAHRDAAAAASNTDDAARRRLFVEGEDENDSQKLHIYKALPLDIRVEILEESLLNASTTLGDVTEPPPSSLVSGGGGSGLGPPLIVPPSPPLPPHLSNNGNTTLRPMTADTMMTDRVENRGDNERRRQGGSAVREINESRATTPDHKIRSRSSSRSLLLPPKEGEKKRFMV